jgi:hypothetical protein
MGRSGQNFDDVMLPFLGAADSAADAQPKRFVLLRRPNSADHLRECLQDAERRV